MANPFPRLFPLFVSKIAAREKIIPNGQQKSINTPYSSHLFPILKRMRRIGEALTNPRMNPVIAIPLSFPLGFWAQGTG
jgi:hypothetical protein